MKHNTLLLFLMAMLCLFFSSCDDETGKNLLKLNKEKITLNHEKATEKITVTAGAAWQVSGVPEWMRVTPSESQEINQEIVIEADDNDTFEQRTATLLFNNGHITRKLEITQLSLQEADAFIKFEKNEVHASLTREFKIELITNRPWKVENAPEWVKVTPLSGEKSDSVSLVFDENYHPDGREGEILFVAEGAQTKLNISQIGLKDIHSTPFITIFRTSKMSTTTALTYCDVENNFMFVNPAIKDKVFLGNLLSHNVSEGTNIPAFTGYTLKPITISQTSPTDVRSKTYTPSLTEQADYVKKVLEQKPQQMEELVADNGTTDFYSYRLLHAIGAVNLGVNLNELATGHSYADREMEGKYGLIFSFRHTLFSLIMDLPSDGSVINEKLKDADKKKGVSYVSSMSYGKIGLLIVETETDSRKVKAAINKYINEETLDAAETSLIKSASVTYVYFDNNNQPKTKKAA